ncbi:MAG TPA: efflux RND transporter periplasmic adaptor subunit [Thiohalobacter sp.]|nr:efflux RND transporter periplasmic adaptor subunit [Thiohalobacter sp.]
MKSLPLIIITATLFVSALSRAADNRLELTAEQIAALGIETASTTATDHISGRSLPARVRVPPDHNHVVTSLFAGRITAIRVVEGQRVEAGQALIELNSPGLLRQQREYLDALNQQRLAQANHDRDETLFEAGIIPERRLQDTRVKLQAARAALSEQAQLLGLGGIQEDVITQLGQTHLPRATVTLSAPIAGVVTDLMATAGQAVEAGQGLAQVAAVESLWLEIRLASEQVRELEPGMRIRLSDSPAAGGTLLSIGQRVDPATNTLGVWARLDAGISGMRPGQLVNVRITSGTHASGLSVPASALFQHSGRDYIFVRSDRGFIAMPVEVSGRYHNSVTLRSVDLRTDSRVAVSGIAALKAAWLGMGGGE